MPAYSLTPYLVQARRRRGSRADVLPIDDVDADGGNLLEWVGSILQAREGPNWRIDPDSDRVYRINEVLGDRQSLLVRVESGTRGLNGRLFRAALNSNVPRTEIDTEFIDLRHLVVAPANGYGLIVLAERAGLAGVSTFTNYLMKQSLTTHLAEAVFDVEPLASLELLEAWADVATLNKVTFRAPRPTDTDGRFGHLEDRGGDLAVVWKPRGVRRLRSLMVESQRSVDKTQLFGILSSALDNVLGDHGISTARYIEQGWQATVTLGLSDGKQRSFDYGSDDGPKMDFPIDLGAGRRGRPTDAEFLASARQALVEMQGNYSITATTASGLSLPTSRFARTNSIDWKCDLHESNIADPDNS